MPKIINVYDIKPKLEAVSDVKPKMEKFDREITQVYYEPETTLGIGQVMGGLLLVLTYAEEHTHIPVRY